MEQRRSNIKSLIQQFKNIFASNFQINLQRCKLIFYFFARA